MRSGPSARSNQIMLAVKCAVAACAAAATPAHAQQAGLPGEECKPGQPSCVQEVVVTGSRIARVGAQAEQPLSVISAEAIEKTGLASVGDLLQQLTTGGKALNTKFNSSGNFGYPPDGGGIGAGSTQIDLRSLDSKRVLVLVDGIRWVNESSASGVSGSADLNTIPMSIVDHIEILEDGASAIYGSDAIAGVVNIITRKKVDGVEVNGYTGALDKGGRQTEASFTAGGSSDKFSGMFVVSYFNQDAISSGKWAQSSFPEPVAGLLAGSSGTPQGRFIFCDPNAPATVPESCAAGGDYSVTLNNGTTTPAWSPNNPATDTYHHFTNSDRFNYAPFNLLSTPSERKSIFTNLTYHASEDVDLYFKGLFNNRQSANQAAPEPIFVGPGAGSGGLADTISVAANNPYNPFGYALDAATNFVLIGRRPLEVGPRIFTQDVNTYYFSAGFKGTLHVGNGFLWDINYANSDNKATQSFLNGYNVAKLKIALGDVNVCNATPGCVPLDLFGGQGRPMTAAMINYIRATQNDSSDQKLQLFSANITGDMFKIGDRAAGFAIGAEHRKYDGAFVPDPLRQSGESQDSPAFPVSASYHVNEAYAEFHFPLLASLGTSAAVRYSDYSTFGGDTTGKVGFRWQAVNDLAFRGTYSKGFRAPNLGELYGLTTFAPTLTDPCGPTSGPVIPLPPGCVAQGVPVGFQQVNTQITVFTGGNPALNPEKSDSYTGGLQYLASWAESAATDRLALEATYYHHKITGAIQAADLQALLNQCIAQGGVGGPICAPFSRQPNGNLNPPRNLLQNFGEIQTGGVDAKIDWVGKRYGWGRLTASLQATDVTQYKAVDSLGIVSQRQVGIEVTDSAIPKLRANAQLGWTSGNWSVSWNLRYLDSIKEACGNAVITDVPGCSNGEVYHTLDSVLYNDVQVGWNDALTVKGLKLDLGVNNVFGQNAPICYTCTLNGYDAGTYDLPGAFWNVRATYKF
ncbi:MAG: TonB-dependent receptor [Gammaproteobacteria bacterium]|nr:MAG: TonB-dependent receptor [Gammaproteobacteria bacterium]TLZ49045.1 MAG: TonB-dependent receptor [Gammaproteobacteria bacterium]